MLLNADLILVNITDKLLTIYEHYSPVLPLGFYSG